MPIPTTIRRALKSMHVFEKLPRFQRTTLVLSDPEESQAKRTVSFYDGSWHACVRVRPGSGLRPALIRCGYTAETNGGWVYLDRLVENNRVLREESGLLHAVQEGTPLARWHRPRVRTPLSVRRPSSRQWSKSLDVLNEAGVVWGWAETSFERTLALGPGAAPVSVQIKGVVFVTPSWRSFRVAVRVTDSESSDNNLRRSVLDALGRCGYAVPDEQKQHGSRKEERAVVARKTFVSAIAAARSASRLLHILQGEGAASARK